jgi:hypothetical protein
MEGDCFDGEDVDVEELLADSITRMALVGLVSFNSLLEFFNSRLGLFSSS